MLDKVKRHCSALRAPDVNSKIAELTKLADSDDPVLQREAAAAIKALLAKRN
ncbi:MAG: hypothetical protein ACE14L_04100 [Terriglobales bacterium]